TPRRQRQMCIRDRSEDVEKLNKITNDLEDTLKDKTDSEKQELQQTISQNKSKKEELQLSLIHI
ncbi:hypothetical protein KQI96_16735, partial [Enterococcus sp. S163_ASV_20]|nr:hypothetical protein [Enterococcus sp. S163_ASV_20]